MMRAGTSSSSRPSVDPVEVRITNRAGWKHLLIGVETPPSSKRNEHALQYLSWERGGLLSLSAEGFQKGDRLPSGRDGTTANALSEPEAAGCRADGPSLVRVGASGDEDN